MAIRKLRKNMKPVIWAITIFFLVSLVGGYALTIKDGLKGSEARRDYALKVNGNKVSTIQIERSMYNMVNNYSKYLGDKTDRELINLIAFNDVVDRKIALNIATKLKISVPTKEIDAEYEKIQASVGDKEQFKRMLAMQGLTKVLLKEEIKDSLTIQKTLEKLQADAEVGTAEVEEYYNINKNGLYAGKSLDEVKKEILETLKDEKGLRTYLIMLAEEKRNAKIEDVQDNYKEYLEKPEIEKDGFIVTNVDVAKATLNGLFKTGGDKEKAEDMAKNYYESRIKISKAAQEKGIIVSDALPLDEKFMEYDKELRKRIANGISYTEKEIEEFFENNKAGYNVTQSADAYIAMMRVEPSEEDKEVAKEKAIKILEEATPENFNELAKKYSQDPGSAANGGELGWFGKGDMVQPFEEAVFKGKIGEIYSELVETQFGYHIIYVIERNEAEAKAQASHILIMVTPSESTMVKELEDAKKMAEKIEKKELTFENLTEDEGTVVFSQMFNDISDSGYIPGLGFAKELSEDIFKAPKNKIEVKEINGNIFIFDKTKEVKAQEANLELMKEQVIQDYKNFKVQKEIEKITKEN